MSLQSLGNGFRSQIPENGLCALGDYGMVSRIQRTASSCAARTRLKIETKGSKGTPWVRDPRVKFGKEILGMRSGYGPTQLKIKS